MPQSLSVVYIHLVFSSKERRPFLREPRLRQSVHAYLGEVSKQSDCAPIVIGGVEDHVHVLARLGRTVTQAEWVKELKRVSNEWIQNQGISDFQWQSGYAAFSVSQSNLEEVKAYIVRQEEHHQQRSFQDELRASCVNTRWNGMRNLCGIEEDATPLALGPFRMITQGSSRRWRFSREQPWASDEIPLGFGVPPSVQR